MMASPQDIEATALLSAVVETCGGDLRAAFARLCAAVPPEEIEGECFRVALSRAVGALVARSVPTYGAPANDA